ncbi:hypothetical protein EC919_104361 [Pseudomonas graminis]|nr:hypothetical protein EC919_104361 [Pseudomonas graminis]
MTILIMSAWAVGILLLIAVAVYRGRASMPRAPEAAPRDESEVKSQTKRGFHEANSLVNEDIRALFAEMHELRLRRGSSDEEHLDILISPSVLRTNMILMETLKNTDRSGPRSTKKAATQAGII